MMYPWSQTFVSIPPSFHQGRFPQVGLQDLLEEVNLIDCSEATAVKSAGPLTRSAIQQINELCKKQIDCARAKGLVPIIEAHVHRLMPGQFPSCPGWHCSGVPRRMYNGEPNFELIVPEQFSVCVTLSSEPRGLCPKEFVQTSLKPKLWDKEHIFDDLNVQVEKMHPNTVLTKDGQFTWYCPRSILRATECSKRGVRLFVKFTMFPKPPLFNAVGVPEQVFIKR